MRIIDADNLELHKYNSYSEAIANASTLDYKDLVPQGEWIKRPNTKGQVYCSECATLEEITDSSFKSMFCPGCGARMKGADT